MQEIIIFILLLIVIIGVIIVIMNNGKNQNLKLQAVRDIIYDRQRAIKFSAAQNLFRKYILNTYGQNILQFYDSLLIPITCPDAYSLGALLDFDDISDVELERLQQCGFLYNVSLLTKLLYDMKEDTDPITFKNLMTVTLDKIKEFKPLPPIVPPPVNPSMRYVL